MADWSLAVDRS